MKGASTIVSVNPNPSSIRLACASEASLSSYSVSFSESTGFSPSPMLSARPGAFLPPSLVRRLPSPCSRGYSSDGDLDGRNVDLPQSSLFQLILCFDLLRSCLFPSCSGSSQRYLASLRQLVGRPLNKQPIDEVLSFSGGRLNRLSQS